MKKLLASLGVSLALGAFATNAAADITATLNPDKDVTLADGGAATSNACGGISGNPDTSNGAGIYLYSGGSTGASLGKANAFIHFNTASFSGATITFAQISMRMFWKATQSSLTFNARRATTTWGACRV